jgi:hypothetical protein
VDNRAVNDPAAGAASLGPKRSSDLGALRNIDGGAVSVVRENRSQEKSFIGVQLNLNPASQQSWSIQARTILTEH